MSDQISNTFWGGIMEIEYGYREWYDKNPVSFITFLQRFETPKAILNLIYNRSVREEGLVPIEKLPTETKRELIADIGKTEDIISACKALYVIKKEVNVYN